VLGMGFGYKRDLPTEVRIWCETDESKKGAVLAKNGMASKLVGVMGGLGEVN